MKHFWDILWNYILLPVLHAGLGVKCHNSGFGRKSGPLGRAVGLGVWVLFLALLLICHVTLDESLYLSVLQFPQLQNKGNDTSYSTLRSMNIRHSMKELLLRLTMEMKHHREKDIKS